MSAQPPDLEPGDLVWAHVRGYPRWPGQVADIKMARQRHLSLQKANTLLVFFFGDRSFGWFGTDTLEPFEEYFGKYSKQKAKNQNFKRAVEEGKEVLDTRAGRVPETQHRAWDYLDKEDERNQPGYDPDVAAAEAAAAAAAINRVDIRPQDIDADTARAADLPEVLAWMRCVARDPFSLCKHDDQEVQADPMALLVFGLSRIGCVQPLESEEKRLPGRPPGSKTKEPRHSSPAADVDSQDERPPKKRRKYESKVNDGLKAEELEGDDQEARDAAKSLEAVKEAAHKARRAEQKMEQMAEREEQQALLDAQKRSDAADAWHEEVMLMEERGAENVDEELDLDLRTVQTAVLNLARSPLSFLDGRVGTAAAAALRFREAVWCMSCLRTDGIVGDCLLRVLGCEAGHPTSVKFKRMQEAKARTRVPQSIRMPDLETVSTKVGDGYMFMHYVGFIPEGTPQQFLDRLAAFFEENGARLSHKIRMAQGAPLDLSRLFRLVAQQGGYQAVTANWGWRAIAGELTVPKGPTSSNVVAGVRMQYQKLLLAYENKVCLDGEAGGDMHVIVPRRREHANNKKPLPSATQNSGQLAAKRTKRLQHAPGPEETSYTHSAALEDSESGGSSSASSESDDDSVLPPRPAAARRAGQDSDIPKAENGGVRLSDLKAESAVRKQHGGSAVPKAIDVEWKRQTSKRRAAMLSDFDSLEGPRPAATGQGSAPPAAPFAPGTAIPAAALTAQLRFKDDFKTTIVLRFPPGYPLPSKAQLLLAGTNSGPLESSQVVVMQQRYMALIHYSDVEDARRAEVWFSSNAHSTFRVAPNQTVAVSREVRKGDGAASRSKRPGYQMQPALPASMQSMQQQAFNPRVPGRAVGRRPTAPQAGPRTGVPFQPQPPASQPVFDFAGDSSGYNAGGGNFTGQLLGTSLGDSSGGGAPDSRRLLQDSVQQAPQLPTPVDPRRSTMGHHTPQHQPLQQSLSSGWPQHQPQHPGLFMQQQQPLLNDFGGAVGPHLQAMHTGQLLPPGAHMEPQLQHQTHHLHHLLPQTHQVHQLLPHLQQRQHQQPLLWPQSRPQPGLLTRPQAAFGRPIANTMLAAGMPGSGGLVTSGVPNEGQAQHPIAPSPSLASTVDLAAILRSVQPAGGSSPAGARPSSRGEAPMPVAAPAASVATIDPTLAPSSSPGESNMGIGGREFTLGSDLQDLLLQLGGN